MIRVIVKDVQGASDPHNAGMFKPEDVEPFVELLKRHDFYGDSGGDPTRPIEVSTQVVAGDGACVFEVYVDTGEEN